MKYRLQVTNEFKRDLKRCRKRGLPLAELWEVVGLLLEGRQLDAKYRTHILQGDRKGLWECHIRPDWLLIWEQHDDKLILIMLNTGTHSDLFR
ncbi:MAG: type II toxin-antitoxin system YafQ family toxin [Muribaculaceae bacterium]|nr:type II toxin-antitoxin system YafQ family toxin [Muribaculaceae bacterium]